MQRNPPTAFLNSANKMPGPPSALLTVNFNARTNSGRGRSGKHKQQNYLRKDSGMVNERGLFSSSCRQDEDPSESEALLSDASNDQSFVSFDNSVFFGDKSGSDWTADEYETDKEYHPFFPNSADQALLKDIHRDATRKQKQPQRKQRPPQQQQEQLRQHRKTPTTGSSGESRPRKLKQSTPHGTTSGSAKTAKTGQRSTTTATTDNGDAKRCSKNPTNSRRPGEETEPTRRPCRRSDDEGEARPKVHRKKRPTTAVRKKLCDPNRASPNPSDEIRNYLSGDWKIAQTPCPPPNDGLYDLGPDSPISYMESTTEAETDDAAKTQERRTLRKKSKGVVDAGEVTRTVKTKKRPIRKQEEGREQRIDESLAVSKPQRRCVTDSELPKNRAEKLRRQSIGDEDVPKKRPGVKPKTAPRRPAGFQSATNSGMPKKRAENVRRQSIGDDGVPTKCPAVKPTTKPRKYTEYHAGTDSELPKKRAGRVRRQTVDPGDVTPTTDEPQRRYTGVHFATDSELFEKRTERRRQSMAGSESPKTLTGVMDKMRRQALVDTDVPSNRPIDDAMHTPYDTTLKTTPTISRGNSIKEFGKPQPLHRGRSMSPEKQYRRRASVGETTSLRTPAASGPKFGGRVLRTKPLKGLEHGAGTGEELPSPSTPVSHFSLPISLAATRPQVPSTSKAGLQQPRRGNASPGYQGEASLSDFAANGSRARDQQCESSSYLSFDASKGSLVSGIGSYQRLPKERSFSALSNGSQARRQNRGSSSNKCFDSSKASLRSGTTRQPKRQTRASTSQLPTRIKVEPRLNKSYNAYDSQGKSIPLNLPRGPRKLDLDDFSKSTASTTLRSSKTLGSSAVTFDTSTSLTVTPVSPSGTHGNPLRFQDNFADDDDDEVSLQLSTLLARAGKRDHGKGEQKFLVEDPHRVGSGNTVSSVERKVLSPFAPEAAKPLMLETFHDSFANSPSSIALAERSGSKSFSNIVTLSEQCGINIFEPPIIPASCSDDESVTEDRHDEIPTESAEREVGRSATVRKQELSFRRSVAEAKIEDPAPRTKAAKRESMLWKLLHAFHKKSLLKG